MATAARNIKELVFEWEGRDKNGKILRGEIRAGGEAAVSASLRRQGILLTKVKSAEPVAAAPSSRATSRCSHANSPR